jgi:hypothetical protein
VVFFLISCEDALSPQEYPPLPNENPTGGEGEDPLGYWRIWGVIDAPLDWTPNSTTVQIWMTDKNGYEYQLEEAIYFACTYTGPNSKRWTFKTGGTKYYGEGQSDPDPFFEPDPIWWSFPYRNPPEYCRTYVRGYTWVEFGGGGSFVLTDEDTAHNPFNPASIPPGSDWKYYPIYPGDEYDLWAWDSVYLDLTD